MLYLLIAMAICLLVPWLPVLLLRLAPVRPAPPLSREEMERLRAQLYAHVTRRSGKKAPVDPNREAVVLPRRRERSPSPKNADATAPQAPQEVSDAPPDRGLSHLTLRSYRWVGLIVLPVFLVTMFGLAAAWALLFDFLANAHAKTFPTGVYLFKPAIYWAIFSVPAIFLGIFGSAGIVEPLVRILLGRRYTEYCHWEQARRGLHGPAGVQHYGKLFVHFATVLGTLMALWVLLAMNWYVCLTENDIILKPLFGIRESVYSYDRVRQIVLTSHLRVKNDAIEQDGLHLRFDDGQTWSTGQTFRLPDAPQARKQLLEFLAQKTGKPLTRARLIEDVPGW